MGKKRTVPIKEHASRTLMSMAQNSYAKQHNPYLRKASFAECIDPINRHTSHFGKGTGPWV